MTLLILITFAMEGPIFLRDDKTFFYLFQRHPSCMFLYFLLSYAVLDQLLRIFFRNDLHKMILQFPLLRFSFRTALSFKASLNIRKVNVREALSIKTTSNIRKMNVRDAISIKITSNIRKINVRKALSIKTTSNIRKVNVRDALSIKTTSNIRKINVSNDLPSHFKQYKKNNGSKHPWRMEPLLYQTSFLIHLNLLPA